MPLETLDFEEPVAIVLKEIEALTQLPRTDARDREIEALTRRLESVRGELYKSLTPWQRVLVARHPNRPSFEDFSQRLFSGFTEIHGDRRFADDHALMTGFADYKGQPVLLVGHVKGGDTKEKIFRNFGYAQAGGLSEGDAGDAARREVQPRGDRVRRYAGGVSRVSNRRSAASPRRSPSTCAT